MGKRSFQRTLKYIGAWMLCICMGMSFFQTSTYGNTEKDTYGEGTYTIKGFLRSATSDQASMGNAAIVQPMKIIHHNGSWTIQMECKALSTKLGTKTFRGYLAKMRYYPGWSGGSSGIELPTNQNSKSLQVEEYYKNTFDTYNDPKNGTDSNVKGRLYPHYMQLPAEEKQEEIWVQVYVPVMEELSKGNGLQYARLQLDWDTIKKVSDEVPDLTKDAGDGVVSTDDGNKNTSTTDSTTTTATTEKKETTTKLNYKKLNDGIYSVTGTMVKADRKSTSMANEAVAHKIQLNVKNGKYYLTLDFQGMKISYQFGYLSNMKYFLSGYQRDSYGAPKGTTRQVTVKSYQKTSSGAKVKDAYGTNYPNKVTFPLISEAKKDGYVPLQVFVPIMDAISPGSGTQALYLKLHWATIKKVSSSQAFGDNQSSGSSTGAEAGSFGTSGSGTGTSAATGSGSMGDTTLPDASGEHTQTLANGTLETTAINQQEQTTANAQNASELVEEEQSEHPAAVPVVMSVLSTIAGVLYKGKSRGFF